MKKVFAMIAALLWVQLALAIDTAPAFDDPAQQAHYDRIIRELRCLQCRSETIADSNAPLAADLRRQVTYSSTRGGEATERYWSRFMGAEVRDAVLTEYSPGMQMLDLAQSMREDKTTSREVTAW